MPFGACHELLEPSSVDEILDFIIQLNAIMGIMIVVSMIPAVLRTVLFAKIGAHWIRSL